MRTIEYLYKKDIGGREEQQDSVNIVQNESIKNILILLTRRTKKRKHYEK